MPIYEYACTACGRRIDVMHSVHGTGPATCEVCGGAMKKALTAPAIPFKGSGWAKKDARSAPAPASTATPSAEGTASGDAAPAPAAGSGEAGAAKATTPAATPAPATPSASGGTGG